MANLTEKQKRFVAEYLIDLNATQAAIRAGYSKKNADKIGSELLGKTRVSQALQKAIQERQQRTEINQDYVLKKLKEIADKEASDALGSELKYTSKIKALELLGKHLGVFDGNNAAAATPENNLFAAIDAWEEDAFSDIPEIQPPADADDEVVEAGSLPG